MRDYEHERYIKNLKKTIEKNKALAFEKGEPYPTVIDGTIYNEYQDGRFIKCEFNSNDYSWIETGEEVNIKEKYPYLSENDF